MKKTPITYYGGKQLMTRYILPLIPQHTTYTEPFFGGGAIFFAKEKSQVEIINDLNASVVTFYRECKNNFEKLQALVQTTLHSRHEHKQAKIIYDNPELFSELRRAWAFYVLCNQGFGGMISDTWGYGVEKNKSELRTKNKRDSFLDYIRERLEIVQIECDDALKVIKSRDRVETFHYCDPPYYNSDMGHYGGYTIQNFEALLKTLSEVKGKFLLSSYPSEILNQYTADNNWHTIEVKQRVAVSSKGKTKIEVLTANYDINSMLPQDLIKDK